MSAEHIRPCTGKCDHGDRPHLSQGYFCGNCGDVVNMLATGHYGNNGFLCSRNAFLVEDLRALNGLSPKGRHER